VNNQRFILMRMLSVVILSILFIIPGTAFAEQWRSFTDINEVRDIVFFDGVLWCATGGGLAGFHADGEYYEIYSNLSGFDGNSLNRITTDSEDGLWLAVQNRILQRFDPSSHLVTHTVSQVSEVSSINDIIVDTRGIYLATNAGIARVKYYPDQDQWHWYERYTRLDSFPDQTAVNAIEIQGDFLWAATAHGVARGDMTAPAPLTWENYTSAEGLAGNDVHDIAVFNDALYAGTDNGVSVWNGLNWTTSNASLIVSRLEAVNGSLLAVTQDNVVSFDGTGWSRIGAARSWATSITVDDQNRTWIGLTRNGSESGGVALAGADSWTNMFPNCPSTNIAFDMTFANNGDLLLVGGRISGEFGLNRWNTAFWQSWTRPEMEQPLFDCSHRSVAVDITGGIWVGTSGGGVANYTFNADGTLNTVNIFDHSAGRLIGYDDGRNINTVLAPAVAADDNGNIWVVNRGAVNGNVLVCIPREFIENPSSDIDWYYFHRSLFGNFPNPDLIAIDGHGRKWLATTSTSGQGRGVYMFNDNNTPLETADDDTLGPIPGLHQQEARCIAWDPDGYIWVGTIDGAYYMRTDVDNLRGYSFRRFYHAQDEPVNAIAFDSAGNKWLGTNHGIMIIAPDLFTVIDRITTDYPSQLPDSVVNSIVIDPRDGWAYIGTNAGTAGMRTPYRDYGPSIIEDVTVEPNPFKPGEGDGRLYFTGTSLANDASVAIYTPDGRLVRKLNYAEAGRGWNGYNDNCEKVASGIYLILTYNGKSQAGQGKVAVIW